MTIEDISVTAANGKEPPDMTATERALWWPLKELYAAARAGEVTTAEAKKRKAELIERYEKDRAHDELMARLLDWHLRFWAGVEDAGTAYAKSDGKTPEGDAFYEAVYQVKPVIGTAGNRKENT